MGEIIAMAHDGASGVEIAHALDLKAHSVRAKLNSLGIRLRHRVRATRLRMVVGISGRMRLAADARGVTVQQLIRRLLHGISRDNLFDTILPLPVPHSVGARLRFMKRPRQQGVPQAWRRWLVMAFRPPPLSVLF
jgi:hypothetical protein